MSIKQTVLDDLNALVATVVALPDDVNADLQAQLDAANAKVASATAALVADDAVVAADAAQIASDATQATALQSKIDAAKLALS